MSPTTTATPPTTVVELLTRAKARLTRETLVREPLHLMEDAAGKLLLSRCFELACRFCLVGALYVDGVNVRLREDAKDFLLNAAARHSFNLHRDTLPENLELMHRIYDEAIAAAARAARDIESRGRLPAARFAPENIFRSFALLASSIKLKIRDGWRLLRSW